LPPRPARSKPELLAPAGNLETFFSALRHGADAVYVGAQQFNARLRARNFSLDDLARMIAYAHDREKRIYVTVNTLVKEEELPALAQMLDALRRIGPDALIIQDLGVYRLARRLAPEVPLHASTQMTVHNLEGALQAERMGFERVILARELTLEEIAHIRRNSRIGLEVFIHGALCYSISGQCYFSSHAHGKSANRGRCLQPCRRMYDGGAGPLPVFAPPDLCAAPALPRLIALGLRGFKIEGRLKPAETIAQTVAAYRLLIDAHPRITREVVAEARRRLDLAIGRRQTTGFLLDASPRENMAEEGTSQSGRVLGNVLESRPGRFLLEPREMVKTGDRLRAEVSRREPPRAFTVKSMMWADGAIKRCRPNKRVWIEAPFALLVDSPVLKVIDADALPRKSRTAVEKVWPGLAERSRLALPARLETGEVVTLRVTVGSETLAVEQTGQSWERTPRREAAALLESPSERFPIRLRLEPAKRSEDAVPLGVKEIEALRERALSQALRRMDRQRDAVLGGLSEPLPASEKAAAFAPQRLIRVRGMDEAREAVEMRRIAAERRIAHGGLGIADCGLGTGDCGSGTADGERDAFLIPLSEVLREDSLDTVEQSGARERLILDLPPFLLGGAEERGRMEEMLGKAVKLGLKRFVVSNLLHFTLLRRLGARGLFLIADSTAGCLNSEHAAQLEEMGASLVVFSIEGDRATLERLAARVGPERLVVQVYGAAPLFRSRQPWPAAGRVVPVGPAGPAGKPLRVLRRDGLTQVIPQTPYSIRQWVPELRALGIRRFLYDLSWGEGDRADVSSLLEEAPVAASRGETSANFQRGLE
jgi:putative protease